MKSASTADIVSAVLILAYVSDGAIPIIECANNAALDEVMCGGKPSKNFANQ